MVLRRIVESVRQLIAWFPMIWHTRDSDYGYLLEIMEFKMDCMYKFLTSDKCMSELDEEALLALKRCKNIIDCLQDGKWNDDAYEDHYEKFPMKPFDVPMTEEESANFRAAMADAEKSHEKLVKEFGKLFGKYYRYWWD